MQVVAAYMPLTRIPEPAGTDLHNHVRRLAAISAARLDQEPLLEVQAPAHWGWGEHEQRGVVVSRPAIEPLCMAPSDGVRCAGHG